MGKFSYGDPLSPPPPQCETLIVTPNFYPSTTPNLLCVYSQILDVYISFLWVCCVVILYEIPYILKHQFLHLRTSPNYCVPPHKCNILLQPPTHNANNENLGDPPLKKNEQN